MKATRRMVLASLVGTALIAAAPQAVSQQTDLKKSVIGGWTLVSAYNEKDGQKTEMFGSNPQGYMTFGQNGRFSFQAFQPGKATNFAGKTRPKATPAEAHAVVLSSIAYFGTYKVNEKDGVMDWNIEQSTFPNIVGPTKRTAKLAGDELTLTNPGARAGGVNHFVWKRAK
jgi:lipocalin-like protein